MSAEVLLDREELEELGVLPGPGLVDRPQAEQINFFGLPRLGAGSELRGHRAVLVGVPFDGGAQEHSSARFAPHHTRRASAGIGRFHPVHRVDVFAAVRGADAGNVPIPEDPALAIVRIEEEISRILRASAVPFVAGGCSAGTLPAVRAIHAKHGPLACIHVGAHLDLSAPGAQDRSSSTFHDLLEASYLEDAQLYQIGVRAPWSGPGEDILAARHGTKVFPMEELVEHGIPSVGAQVRAQLADRPVFLSFNLEAVDPAFAPATPRPAPGGLAAREAFRLIRSLAGINLVGMEVTGLLPALDRGELSSTLAAHVLYEGLALVAVLERRRVTRPY